MRRIVGGVDGRRIALIGAGGVGKAIGVALGEAGAGEIRIFDRDVGKASALADALAQNAVKQAIIGIGGVVQSSSPAELTAYQRAEYAKWGEVVRVSGAKMN